MANNFIEVNNNKVRNNSPLEELVLRIKLARIFTNFSKFKFFEYRLFKYYKNNIYLRYSKSNSKFKLKPFINLDK